jgi:hypothetical protein
MDQGSRRPQLSDVRPRTSQDHPQRRGELRLHRGAKGISRLAHILNEQR